MQTFVPYGPDFQQTAAVLDRQRLGKQRVEVLQILKALTEPHYGWRHHPAVKMWRGCEGALVQYGLAMCEEWMRRGYQDGVSERLAPFAQAGGVPAWLHDSDVVRSHRSNLIRKLPGHYGPLWPDVPADLPYVWPAGQPTLLDTFALQGAS